MCLGGRGCLGTEGAKAALLISLPLKCLLPDVVETLRVAPLIPASCVHILV